MVIFVFANSSSQGSAGFALEAAQTIIFLFIYNYQYWTFKITQRLKLSLLKQTELAKLI